MFLLGLFHCIINQIHGNYNDTQLGHIVNSNNFVLNKFIEFRGKFDINLLKYPIQSELTSLFECLIYLVYNI